MAVHIRLQRHGSHNRPFYHVVATDHKSARNGKFLEKLGYYDPKISPSVIELKADRMQEWFGKGAVLSNTVAKLVKLKKLELKRNQAAPRQPKKTSK
jgi:small subunit ribosomal protein S16